MKLIKSTPKQRYYQLDFKIKNCFSNGVPTTIESIFKNDPIKFREGFELAEDISEYIDKICISDANTHIERLVFPAFNIRNIETGEITLCHRCNKIDGYNTFMIHGGDINSIWDDKVYIRHLRMANKKN